MVQFASISQELSSIPSSLPLSADSLKSLVSTQIQLKCTLFPPPPLATVHPSSNPPSGFTRLPE